MHRRTVIMSLGAAALMGSSAGAWSEPDDKQQSPPAVTPLALKVGDAAPDFSLLDQKRNKVTLSSFKGKKNVALAFYIFAFTGG